MPHALPTLPAPMLPLSHGLAGGGRAHASAGVGTAPTAPTETSATAGACVGAATHQPLLIPQLGVGTYKVADADAERVVSEALALGYRHVDTAQMYGNEAGVGRALATCGIPRDQLFVTSMLNNPHHKPADVRRTFAETMDRLGLEVLDLFLVHWPLARTPGLSLIETWEAMIGLLDTGRVRAIGVSNYEPEHLRTIIDATGVLPAVNQVEIHPYLTQEPLRRLHAELGIVTESWSPLGRGQVLGDPVVTAIAHELGVSASQVVIRWHLQHGLVVFPKSVHPERLRANAEVFGFSLTSEQMARLDALNRDQRTGSSPDKVQLAPQE